MLLGGLWHGASWNFLTWGGLNGIGLVVYKYWKRISPYEKLNMWYVRMFKIALTFSFISFTRIWFRSPDQETANVVLNKLTVIDWSIAPKVIENFYVVFGLFLLAMIIHWLPTHFKRSYRHWFIRSNPVIKIAAVFGTVILIWQTISAEFVPFIYFQF
jgi:D-alanyl-lipoteichoic acid acyltransferase DltB (MBOAT superfamily)